MTAPPRAPVLTNDFSVQWREIRQAAVDAFDRVGRSGRLILGQEVEAFERELAAWHGVAFAIGTGSGLDALEIALRCSGVRSGHVVLTTPLTAFATTLAIVRVGARPAFVDVDGSGLMDLDAAESALERDREIRAVLPVHLYGHAVDLKRLRTLHERFEVAMVEDCAQAIGARSHGVPVGSVSQAAATSFYPTKNLGALGDGGAVLTNDEPTRVIAANLRDYGQSTKYVHDVLGLNSRLDEIHAAILRTALLPRLSGFTERRRQIARMYAEGVRNSAIEPIPCPEGSESVWHLYPLLVADRDLFVAHLKAQEIGSGIHYPTLTCDQRALDDVGAYRVGTLERAAEIARREVSLPIHPYLDDQAVERVIEACNAWRP